MGMQKGYLKIFFVIFARISFKSGNLEPVFVRSEVLQVLMFASCLFYVGQLLSFSYNLAEMVVNCFLTSDMSVINTFSLTNVGVILTDFHVSSSCFWALTMLTITAIRPHLMERYPRHKVSKQCSRCMKSKQFLRML